MIEKTLGWEHFGVCHIDINTASQCAFLYILYNRQNTLIRKLTTMLKEKEIIGYI